MTPELKKEILERLDCVIIDINLLKSDDWKPDDDSCDATLDNLHYIKDNLS